MRGRRRSLTTYLACPGTLTTTSASARRNRAWQSPRSRPGVPAWSVDVDSTAGWASAMTLRQNQCRTSGKMFPSRPSRSRGMALLTRVPLREAAGETRGASQRHAPRGGLWRPGRAHPAAPGESGRTRRSALLPCPLQNHHTLHMMRHRKEVGLSRSAKRPGQRPYFGALSRVRVPGASNERQDDIPPSSSGGTARAGRVRRSSTGPFGKDIDQARLDRVAGSVSPRPRGSRCRRPGLVIGAACRSYACGARTTGGRFEAR